MSHADLHDQVAAYYSGKLAAHGATPAGVDWNSSESQQFRFRQLARLWEGCGRATFVDYGCGYGALADFLSESGVLGHYTGYDVAPRMVEAAVALHAGQSLVTFTSRRDDVQPADFTIASGIFNVKLDTPVDRWADYVHETLDDMAALSVRGFAFNALTTYSDPERRRPDLFYADPAALFDRCKRRFSRFVTLVHDYPLYEFTMIVRLPGRHG
jgi:SAM-dependent methyltransferase